MKTKKLDNKQIRIDLIKAMLTHVPFDGWTWEAMEQGAIDIGFETVAVLFVSSALSVGNLKVVEFVTSLTVTVSPTV